MGTSGARRGPQEYPVELRERAVRMVLDIRGETGRDEPGVIPRIAKQLGIGVESLRGWVNQAEIDAGRKPGTSTVDAQRIFELVPRLRTLWENNYSVYGRRKLTKAAHRAGIDVGRDQVPD